MALAQRIDPPSATYVDLLALPEHQVGEIIAGELYVSPRPATTHSRASSSIGFELTGPWDRGRGGPGGWIILDEPELHLDGDVLVPDLAGWRRTRLPVLPAAPAITLAPDWVCEVLSPSTARLDRIVKMPTYARAGVGHLWLIDPRLRTLEVFRRSETSGFWELRQAFSGDSTVAAEPFEAVPLELAGLWADVEPEP